jgi:cytoskeletal protein CcmA (bactofilin family)
MNPRSWGQTRALILLVFFLSLLSCTTGNFAGGNFLFGDQVSVGKEEKKPGGFCVAGANLDLAGQVQGEMRAAGANIYHSGIVEGPLKVAGANVTLAGQYHGKVRAAAANLTLAGTFDGPVVAFAAKITVAPTAVLKGDLIYRAAVLDRQEGSRIMGKVAEREIPRHPEWFERGKKVLATLGLVLWILSMPALIIIGAFLHYLFPQGTDAISATISKSPWKNIGIGLVFLVVTPVGILISFFTIVGIPAGIIAALLYGILLYISRIYVAVWIGRKILWLFRKSLVTSFFWPLVVGTVVTAVLFCIPIIGWLFRLFFLLLGLGAMWVFFWRSIQQNKSTATPAGRETAAAD